MNYRFHNIGNCVNSIYLWFGDAELNSVLCQLIVDLYSISPPSACNVTPTRNLIVSWCNFYSVKQNAPIFSNDIIYNNDINHIYFHKIILTIVWQMKECVLCAIEWTLIPDNPMNE